MNQLCELDILAIMQRCDNMEIMVHIGLLLTITPLLTHLDNSCSAVMGITVVKLVTLM